MKIKNTVNYGFWFKVLGANFNIPANTTVEVSKKELESLEAQSIFDTAVKAERLEIVGRKKKKIKKAEDGLDH